MAFEPLWRTRYFWLPSCCRFGALLGFCGWQWRQARLGDLRARRVAALRTAKAEADGLLRQDFPNPGDFYSRRRAPAPDSKRPSPTCGEIRPRSRDGDAETVCAGQSLDAGTAADVHELFAAHDELRYAGAGGQEEPSPLSAGSMSCGYSNDLKRAMDKQSSNSPALRAHAKARTARRRKGFNFRAFAPSRGSFRYSPLRAILLSGFGALVFGASLARGRPRGFDAANKRYDKGDFQGARTAYEALVKSGNYSANLFYNLGNADYRLGKKGDAFVAYERALALDRGASGNQSQSGLLREETGARLPAALS